jgi:hypothetical protein
VAVTSTHRADEPDILVTPTDNGFGSWIATADGCGLAKKLIARWDCPDLIARTEGDRSPARDHVA